MIETNEPTVLCIASFFKGNDFIRECKKRNAAVVLLTREELQQEDWAHECLAEFIAIPGKGNPQSYLRVACQAACRRRVSHVVALEEYDVLTAAQIREYLCLPGMGVTTAHRFQDKLAMRCAARRANIRQPEFVPVINFQVVAEFLERTRGPWMLKPRIGASSMGISKLATPGQVWQAIGELDQRGASAEAEPTGFLLETYIGGDVFHVDSLVTEGRIAFASVERYGAPPFDISHFGGATSSHPVRHGSLDEQELLNLNEQLLTGMGFARGVTHAEFIRRQDSAGQVRFSFLEVAARVGGAYTAETIEAATGLNLWREWAAIELATPGTPYALPQVRRDYSGLVISLARQEYPCACRYVDPEIVYRVSKPWHAGLIVRSPDYQRVEDLLESYTKRFAEDFTAVAPPEASPQQHLQAL